LLCLLTFLPHVLLYSVDNNHHHPYILLCLLLHIYLFRFSMLLSSSFRMLIFCILFLPLDLTFLFGVSCLLLCPILPILLCFYMFVFLYILIKFLKILSLSIVLPLLSI